MNPPPLFAALNDPHGPRKRVPDRCVGDVRLVRTIARETMVMRQSRERGRERSIYGLDSTAVRFRRHDSGVRWQTQQKRPLRSKTRERPCAPSAHRRPGYSLSGCTPAEPDSASPGAGSIAELRNRAQGVRRPTDSPEDRRVSEAEHGKPPARTR